MTYYTPVLRILFLQATFQDTFLINDGRDVLTSVCKNSVKNDRKRKIKFMLFCTLGIGNSDPIQTYKLLLLREHKCLRILKINLLFFALFLYMCISWTELQLLVKN